MHKAPYCGQETAVLTASFYYIKVSAAESKRLQLISEKKVKGSPPLKIACSVGCSWLLLTFDLQVAGWIKFSHTELQQFDKKFEEEMLREEEKIRKRFVEMGG